MRLKCRVRTPALVAEPDVVVVDSPIIAVGIVVVDLVHREVCSSIVALTTALEVVKKMSSIRHYWGSRTLLEVVKTVRLFHHSQYSPSGRFAGRAMFSDTTLSAPTVYSPSYRQSRPPLRSVDT